jgi:hypothetical protein
MDSSQCTFSKTSALDNHGSEKGSSEMSERVAASGRSQAVLQPTRSLAVSVPGDSRLSHQGVYDGWQEAARSVLFDSQRRWYYRDPSGTLRGPFPTLHLVTWVRHGFFSEHLPVTEHPQSGIFQSLSHLLWDEVEQQASHLLPSVRSSRSAEPAQGNCLAPMHASSVAAERPRMLMGHPSTWSNATVTAASDASNKLDTVDRAIVNETRPSETVQSMDPTLEDRVVFSESKGQRAIKTTESDWQKQTLEKVETATSDVSNNLTQEASTAASSRGHNRDQTSTGSTLSARAEHTAEPSQQQTLVDAEQARDSNEEHGRVKKEQAEHRNPESGDNAASSRRRRGKKKNNSEGTLHVSERSMDSGAESPERKGGTGHDSQSDTSEWRKVRSRARSLASTTGYRASSGPSIWPRDAHQGTEPPPEVVLEAQLRHRLMPQDSHVRLARSRDLDIKEQRLLMNSFATEHERDSAQSTAAHSQGGRQAAMARPAPWASRATPTHPWSNGTMGASSSPPSSSVGESQPSRMQRRSFLEIQREEEENERQRLVEAAQSRRFYESNADDERPNTGVGAPLSMTGYRTMADILAAGLTRDRAYRGSVWSAVNAGSTAEFTSAVTTGSIRAPAGGPASSSIPGNAPQSRARSELWPNSTASGTSFWSKIASGSDASKET